MRYDGDRYGGDDDYVLTRPTLSPAQVFNAVTEQNDAATGQATTVQVTADQNDYSLPEAGFVRLSTDASRTFTGFKPQRVGKLTICNVGTQDAVLAHQSASSVAENRIITPTAASYTLNPNESADIIYDFTTQRWRILAGTGA